MAELLNKDPLEYQREAEAFLNELRRFHNSRGTWFPHVPRVTGRPVDLYLLYVLVTTRGGWEKVNDFNEWETLAPLFNIPVACVNVGLALKQLYLRYLDHYEKIHFHGEDCDARAEDESVVHHHDTTRLARLRHIRTFNTLPMTYNTAQHYVSDSIRQSLGFAPLRSAIVAADNPPQHQRLQHQQPSHETAHAHLTGGAGRKLMQLDRLLLSLLSPLPNEQDLALNVCTLLSGDSRPSAARQLCGRRPLLSALLAHAGLADDAATQRLVTAGYCRTRRWCVVRFWLDSVPDQRTARRLLQLRECVNGARCRASASCRMTESDGDDATDGLPEWRAPLRRRRRALSDSSSSSESGSSSDDTAVSDNDNDNDQSDDDAATSSLFAPDPAGGRRAPVRSTALAADDTDRSDDDECCRDERQSDAAASASEGLAVATGLGRHERAGQRVLQVLEIVRNLSFDEPNAGCLAASAACLRLLLLAVRCRWGAVASCARDALANVCGRLRLPRTPAHLRVLLLRWTWRVLTAPLSRRGGSGGDRSEMLAALDMLARLTRGGADGDDNDVAVTRLLAASGDTPPSRAALMSDVTPGGVCSAVSCSSLTSPALNNDVSLLVSCVCSLLTLHDIMLLLSSLECLLAVSGLGEPVCHQLARQPGAVATLLALLTVEAQSYGPRACILMKVIQTQTHTTTTTQQQQQPQPQPQQPHQLSTGVRQTQPNSTVLSSFSTQQPSTARVAAAPAAAMSVVGSASVGRAASQPPPPTTPIVNATQRTVAVGSVSCVASVVGAVSTAVTAQRTPPPALTHVTAAGGVKAATTTTTTAAVATSGSAAVSRQIPMPLIHQQPLVSLPKMLQGGVSMVPTENNMWAVKWLQTVCEVCAGASIEQTTLYKQYTASAGVQQWRGVVTQGEFANCVKSVFGAAVTAVGRRPPGQMSHNTATSSTNSNNSQAGIEYYFDGIRSRLQIVTTSVHASHKQQKQHMLMAASSAPVKKQPSLASHVSSAGASHSSILKAQLSAPSRPGGVVVSSATSNISSDASITTVAEMKINNNNNNNDTDMSPHHQQQQHQQNVSSSTTTTTTTTTSSTTVTASSSVSVGGCVATSVSSGGNSSLIKSLLATKVSCSASSAVTAAARQHGVAEQQCSLSANCFSTPQSEVPSSSGVQPVDARKRVARNMQNRRVGVNAVLMNGANSQVESQRVASSSPSAADGDVNGPVSLQNGCVRGVAGGSLSDLLDGKPAPPSSPSTTINGVDKQLLGSVSASCSVNVLGGARPWAGSAAAATAPTVSNNNSAGVCVNGASPSCGGGGSSTTDLLASALDLAGLTGDLDALDEAELPPSVPPPPPPPPQQQVHGLKRPAVSDAPGGDIKRQAITAPSLMGGATAAVSLSHRQQSPAGIVGNNQPQQQHQQQVVMVPHSVANMMFKLPVNMTAAGSAGSVVTAAATAVSHQQLSVLPHHGQLLMTSSGQLLLQQPAAAAGASQQSAVLLAQPTTAGGTGAPRTLIFLPPQQQRMLLAQAGGGGATPHAGQLLVQVNRAALTTTGGHVLGGTQTLLTSGGSATTTAAVAAPARQTDPAAAAVVRTTLAVTASTPVTVTATAAATAAVVQQRTVTAAASQRCTATSTTTNTTSTPPTVTTTTSTPSTQRALPAGLLCEWSGCLRGFATAQEVYRHAVQAHCPAGVDELACLWERCDGMPRKRFSLMTHLQDRHCTEPILRLMRRRREQLITAGRSDIVPPAPPPAHPGYSHNAAMQAIRRHALAESKLSAAAVPAAGGGGGDDKEGPVTKSIRLTAALILRNLTVYSAHARRLLRGHESVLLSVAASGVDSSRTVCQILADLQPSQQQQQQQQEDS